VPQVAFPASKGVLQDKNMGELGAQAEAGYKNGHAIIAAFVL
jgi:hypothetical protein